MKQLASFLFLLFTLQILHAAGFLDKNQQFKKYLQQAKILNFSQNTQAIENFRNKWLAKKNLKIRVLGDSHIAADFITHELRTILGNANSIGFTYPIMPDYHQNLLLSYQSTNFRILDSRKKFADYALDYPLGGIIAVVEKLPASITLNVKESLLNIANKNFTTQIIFQGPANTHSFRIEDANHNTAILAAKTQQWEIAQHDFTFPITIYALNEKAKLGGYFIYKKNNPLLIEHLGVNGVRSDIWLKWNLKAVKRQLSLLEYDLIILCYGSNDATLDNLNREKFIRNYSEFIRILRHYNPHTLILLVSPPPVLLPIPSNKAEIKQYRLAKSFQAVQEAIHIIAQKEHTLLFDTNDFIQKTGSKKQWTLNNLSKPDVHLSPAGYKLIANALYKALQDIFSAR
ncbi:hypothetical protein CQA66_03555 [Helicobacter aurati]|uniref:Uncharacterized protein n=1 Tax=Helicobacter aurati TaxID=137778 RepID=A0A3D8J5B9_9HELI|nr:GDSL-type esterase/lipase family protein [Helicobacter aurati]RDU72689.1 hypothetical protein CQA66_03555 [Helicobacter aurati]